MSLGKSSAKEPSATRRNRSQSHRVPGSTSSGTATAPLRMQLRSLRASPLPSRTERASTSSASYSFRSRSPGYENGSTTSPPTTTPARSVPASWHPQSGSPSTRDNSRTPPSPADETPANWQSGFDAAPTGGSYSTPRTTDLGTNPTPSSSSLGLTSPTTPHSRASPDGSSTVSQAPLPPFTPSAQPPRPLSTGGSTPSSFATESWTRRQRLSTIASATSRQRFREFWQTSGLPLDVSREPKPRYDWDTSDSEPEAFENRRGSGGDGQEHSE